MHRIALLLVAASLLGACKSTPAGACRRYVKAQNECSRELGDSTLPPLYADTICLAFSLPGFTGGGELKDEYNCLADAYLAADCSSEEAFYESFNSGTCGEDVEDSDTAL